MSVISMPVALVAEWALVALIVGGALGYLVRRFVRRPERACARCDAASVPPSDATGTIDPTATPPLPIGGGGVEVGSIRSPALRVLGP